MTFTVKPEDEPNIIKLKSGLYMLYDHVLRNGGKFIHNEGTWGNKDYADARRVTCDDMQTFCLHGDQNCRIMDLGKKVITIMMPNEKTFFLCGYHSFIHALTERYTEEGYRVENTTWDNAHP